MTESKAFRRARKEAIVAANQAGVEATLRKGREMDEEQNRKPVIVNVPRMVVPEERIKQIAEIAAEAALAGMNAALKESKKIEPVHEEEAKKEQQVPEKEDAVPAEIVQTTTLEQMTKRDLLAMIRKLSAE